ncbi:MAG TPA: universal stress protein [Nitrospiria bacterium]|nr:universal stress protein [Nitrospiria bacterium]
MYKQIYIPVDNSDYSNMAIDIGVELARQFGSTVVGSHVYAAKMHDKRFKQMEAGLPEEYHDEQELEKQRKIHDSLITRGLELITDSYLDVVAKKCDGANVPLVRRSLEGKNFKLLVDDITQHQYDLVIMGALGVGAVGHSLIGSVTERVARRIRQSDLLVVKNMKRIPAPNSEINGNRIVVAIDGSPQSYGGLKTAVALGRAFQMPIEAVAAFDPYFHYAMFNSIAGVLSDEAGKTFRFKEQEKLHEEVIDSGLAKIYQAQLDIGRDVAKEEGVELKTTLLDGKPFEKVIQYVKKVNPWLLIVGRIGVHSDEEMDIGSNSENLMRLAPCHVLLSSRKHVPSYTTTAEYTTAWTEEATKRMEKVPAFARNLAKSAIYRYAVEKGHTIISNSVVDAAMGHLLPPSAVQAMADMGKVMREKGIDPNAMQASTEVAKDLNKGGMAGMIGQLGAVTGEVKAGGDVLSYQERMRALDYYLCEGCGYVGKGDKPVLCPVCGAAGESFKFVDKTVIEAAAKAEGGIELEVAYDDVPLEWTKEARERLRETPSGYVRRRAKAKIEKSARKLGVRTITKELAGQVIDEYLEVPGMASHGGTQGQPAFDWTADAQARLERVPPGFMRDCTKAMIEKHARSINVATITLEVANAGIDQARTTMEEAMKNPGQLDQIVKNLMESAKS